MGGFRMIKQHANPKDSYVVSKLDYMLDQYADYGYIDIQELHSFIVLFRLLPQRKQKRYSYMLDEVVELWDAAEQPEY
jgi:hypothetical protein